MKIINTIFILTIGFLLATACQTNPTTTNNTVNQNVNKTNATTNQNTAQANKPETNTAVNEAKTESNTAASSSVSTPTAAYKAAYAARKNKDIKALKQLISKDMFEFFEMMGEGKPNAVDEGLKEMCETPQGASDDARNEKIKGDTATIEYLDAKGEWHTMDLVKEDGSWKLTIAKMNQSEGKNDKKNK